MDALIALEVRRRVEGTARRAAVRSLVSMAMLLAPACSGRDVAVAPTSSLPLRLASSGTSSLIKPSTSTARPSAQSLDPLLFTTLNSAAAVTTPVFGTGQAATITTAPANDFKPAIFGKGLLANKAGEAVRFPQTSGGIQNIELEHGTMDFWYRPNYNHDKDVKYTIAGTGNWGMVANRKGSMHLGKHNKSNQWKLFLIFHDANGKRYEHNVVSTSYSWRAGDWLQIRITWDFNVPAGEQNIRLYLNGVELPLTGQVSRGPQLLPAETSTEMIYIGSRNMPGGVTANGMHDDFRIWDHVIVPVPHAVASVSLAAPDSGVAVGDPAVQATVVARDFAKNVLSLAGRTVVWTSSAPAVAPVSVSGLVTPVAAGNTIIGVTVDGVGPAKFTFTVSPRAPVPVASVSASASDSSLTVATAVQATVVARDAANNVLPLTGRAVVWSSTASGVATVSATGLITATGPGTASIGVTVDGVGPATIPITVAAAPVASVEVTAADSSASVGGLPVQAIVIARDAANNVLPLAGRSIVWTSSDRAVATVSASGLVSPSGAGSTTIGVTVDGVGPATFRFDVVPAPLIPVASISVTSPDSSLLLGDPAVQATVVARDAANNILSLTGRVVVWTSSAPSVATVTANGLVDAAGPGSATIGVTVDGVGPATFDLAVSPVAPVGVTISDSSVADGGAPEPPALRSPTSMLTASTERHRGPQEPSPGARPLHRWRPGSMRTDVICPCQNAHRTADSSPIGRRSVVMARGSRRGSSVASASTRTTSCRRARSRAGMSPGIASQRD